MSHRSDALIFTDPNILTSEAGTNSSFGSSRALYARLNCRSRL